MGGASAVDQGRYGIPYNTDWVLGTKYQQYSRMSQVKSPSPSEAITFVDESIETLDDGYFAVNGVTITSWQNSPTVRHGNSGVFGFADGHGERWRWLKLNKDQDLDTSATGNPNTLVDLQRLQRAVWRDY